MSKLREIFNKWDVKSKAAWKQAWNEDNFFGSSLSVLGGLSDIVGSGISNSELQNVEQYRSQIDNYGETRFNDDNYYNLLNDYNSMVQPDIPDWTKLTKSTGEKIGNTASAAFNGALTGYQVGGPWGAIAGGVIGLGAGVIGGVVGDANAQREAEVMKSMAESYRTDNISKFNASAAQINDKMFNAAALNYRAYGGDLYDNAMIMKHYNDGKVKRRKISYIGNMFAYGGQMRLGGDWSNGVTVIGEGGTHEMNPYDGVQVGIDEQGVPNLVEEGEVIFNDYVYSNRLKPTEKQLDEVKLCTTLEGKTFADIAKLISRESEERPNDPISKNGLIDGMMKLQAIQEETREKKARQRFMREFKKLPKEQQEAIVAEQASQSMQQEETPQPDFDFGARYAPNGNPSEQLGEEYGFADGGNLFSEAGRLPRLSDKFKYYNNGKYDEDYLEWLKTYDVKNSKYRSTLSKLYSDAFNGEELTDTKAKELAKDTNFGHFHNAMGEAYDDFLKAKALERQNVQKISSPATMINNAVTRPKEKLKPRTTSEEESSEFDPNDLLRYAPVLGSLAQRIGDIFGANNPDYTTSDMIGKAARSIRTMRAPQLYNYLRFNPYDVNYQQNRLQNIGLGTQRNILNTTSGNRGAALASILQGYNNTLTGIGDMYRTALEYNDNQRKTVADFNRGTDQINLQSILTDEQANQNMDVQRANLILQQAKMMDDINTASSAAISANRNNLYKNLGNVGNDNYYKNQTDWLIRSGWIPDNEQTRRYPRKNGGKIRKTKRMI